MTDKEFRRLTKNELIDIIYEYQKQEKLMQEDIDKLKAMLHSRNLKIKDAGSIADATVALSGIFERAQKTADEYLENIKAANADTEEQCRQMLLDAEAKAARIIAEAKRQAKSISEGN